MSRAIHKCVHSLFIILYITVCVYNYNLHCLLAGHSTSSMVRIILITEMNSFTQATPPIIIILLYGTRLGLLIEDGDEYLRQAAGIKP